MRAFRVVVKWVFACLFGGLVAASLSGCGEDSDSDDSERVAACQRGPYEGTGKVDLEILTPLPTALAPPCGGEPTLLGAVLLVPEAIESLKCSEMTVSSDRVSGCCAGVSAERTVELVMLYRVPSQTLNLGEQIARIDLNDPSDRVVGVSFMGQSFVPLGDNLSDWCSP